MFVLKNINGFVCINWRKRSQNDMYGLFGYLFIYFFENREMKQFRFYPFYSV